MTHEQCAAALLYDPLSTFEDSLEEVEDESDDGWQAHTVQCR